MKRISVFCIFCFLLISNSVTQASSREKEGADFKISQQKVHKFSLQGIKGKEIQTLEQAEKCLEKLLRRKKILVGDFFGINQTGYRYALVFDRLGYIRYRIVQTDKEIKAIKQKIAELKKTNKENELKGEEYGKIYKD